MLDRLKNCASELLTGNTAVAGITSAIVSVAMYKLGIVGGEAAVAGTAMYTGGNAVGRGLMRDDAEKALALGQALMRTDADTPVAPSVKNRARILDL